MSKFFLLSSFLTFSGLSAVACGLYSSSRSENNLPSSLVSEKDRQETSSGVSHGKDWEDLEYILSEKSKNPLDFIL